MQEKKEQGGLAGEMNMNDHNNPGLFLNYNEIIKPEKSYNGELMNKGKKAEEIIIKWLKSLKDNVKNVIDVREWRITQKLDADVIIENIDGKLRLAEIKSDKNLGISENFLFEFMRINHYASSDSIHYLGWVFRSPAKYLLYYAPLKNEVYRFCFKDIREIIGKWIGDCDKYKKPWVDIIFTDKQKTTFNFIVNRKYFDNKYITFSLENSEG